MLPGRSQRATETEGLACAGSATSIRGGIVTSDSVSVDAIRSVLDDWRAERAEYEDLGRWTASDVHRRCIDDIEQLVDEHGRTALYHVDCPECDFEATCNYRGFAAWHATSHQDAYGPEHSPTITGGEKDAL